MIISFSGCERSLRKLGSRSVSGIAKQKFQLQREEESPRSFHDQPEKYMRCHVDMARRTHGTQKAESGNRIR